MKKKNYKGRHAFCCPLPLSASLMSGLEVAIRGIHPMKLTVERGRMDRGMVVGCICGAGS